MNHIKPFVVEQWMDRYEESATHNIAETCCDSISVSDLVAMDSNKPSAESILAGKLSGKRLNYGQIRGSPELRRNIAQMYKHIAAKSGVYSAASSMFSVNEDNCVITPGAIAANFLVMYTMIQRGDHVVCVYPSYQQLYSVPESLGAEVSLWKHNEDKNWELDVNDLKEIIDSHESTKLIIINNPNNPTGTTIPKATLEAIVDIAAEHDIPILCDEVYSPLYHSSDETPPSLLHLYERAIVTGSLSKAFSLAGARIGWVMSTDQEIVEAVAAARDYNTISVSTLSDNLAAYALSASVRDNLIKRNMELCRINKGTLSDFVKAHKGVSWSEPTAGTTALVKFTEPQSGKPLDDKKVCETLMDKHKLLFVPAGHCFGKEEGDFKGYLRVGYACDTNILKEGLAKLGDFLKKEDLSKFVYKDRNAPEYIEQSDDR